MVVSLQSSTQTSERMKESVRREMSAQDCRSESSLLGCYASLRRPIFRHTVVLKLERFHH